MVTAVRFLNGQEALSLTTAAQNMHVFLRKSPLCRSHFFEWLKTVISSNACGTSTLKSPLLRAFFTPHVHPRLRKRLSRCTLNCGLESVKKPHTAGLCGRAVGACDCGLLSCTKIERPSPLEKLSCKVRLFAQNRSRKYRPKVIRTLTSQVSFLPHFNFPHKRPTFAFAGESGYTLGFPRKIAHSGLHGETRGVLDGGAITALGAFCVVRKPCAAGV